MPNSGRSDFSVDCLQQLSVTRGTMTITFYQTKGCPRCARARMHLRALLGESYGAVCTEIDSLAHPRQTWQDGIRMIPALKCDQTIMSGVLLSREQIGQFLFDHGFIAAPPKP